MAPRDERRANRATHTRQERRAHKRKQAGALAVPDPGTLAAGSSSVWVLLRRTGAQLFGWLRAYLPSAAPSRGAATAAKQAAAAAKKAAAGGPLPTVPCAVIGVVRSPYRERFGTPRQATAPEHTEGGEEVDSPDSGGVVAREGSIVLHEGHRFEQALRDVKGFEVR